MDEYLNNYYQSHIYKEGDHSLPYRLMNPLNLDSSKKFPLLVFLHGSAERGNDNISQLRNCAYRFTEDDIRNNYPAYVLFPQCPHGTQWMNARRYITSSVIDLLQTPTLTTQILLNLIDDLVISYPIDSNRLYLAGISMGGFGVWDIISRLPDKFAAAIPICGGGDTKYAEKIKHIPLWVAHGGSDDVVPTKLSQTMVNKIREIGGKPVYTEFQGIGHNSWDTLFYHTQGFFEWLFSKTKSK